MIDPDMIVPLRGPRPEGSEPADRRLPRAIHPSRRSVLGGVAAAGFTAGLTVLGIFPPARPAAAGKYSIKGLPCPSYASGHNCSPGCGPSAVVSGACRSRRFYWYGYHHSSKSSGGGTYPPYKLRKNQCYGGWASGWLWKYKSRCGVCSNGALFRCHDGWTRGSGNRYYKSICRKTLRCL